MRAKKLLILFLLIIGLSACRSNYIEQGSLEYDNIMPTSYELFVQEYTVAEFQDNLYEPDELLIIKDEILESLILDESTLIFAEIIVSYGILELDGFVISQQHPMWNPYYFGYLHPIARRYNVGSLPESWSVLYAFHDITGDGQPELLIGAYQNWSGRLFPYMTGIYTLLDGEPVLVYQYSGGRGSTHLFIDIDGNTIIGSGWGHMGNATEIFYIIDENGQLAMQDALFTYHPDWEHYEQTGEFIHVRLRHIEGHLWDGVRERITEDEYIALINKFGSFGYEASQDENARMVEIEWRHVLALP